MTWRRSLLSGLIRLRLDRVLAPLLRGRATVLMMHRFRVPELELPGHDPGELRQTLEYLRRERHPLLSFEELLARLESGRPDASGAVAFTVDDGYFDQAREAPAVFAAYDCPATFFVASGFLDQTLWMWWDRIEYVLRRTPRHELCVVVGGRERAYRRNASGDFAECRRDLLARCKALDAGSRDAVIAALAAAGEVALPERAPDEYAPMSWDELRRCERQGMRFGPHSVTHPILSRIPDSSSRHEIAESWRRVRAEARQPASVFCYPNGLRDDFGGREIGILRALPLLGAVSSEPGYLTAAALRRDPEARYRVPRFAYPDRLLDLIQYASGIERAKEILGRVA